MNRRRPPTARARAAAALCAAALVALGGCGDDDDRNRTGPDGGAGVTGPHEPAAARLEVEVERVGAGVRIAWAVTNEGDGPLLVFDNLRGDEAPGEPVQGAYVVAGPSDGTVEVGRRLFPVPGDVEGAQRYGLNASELAPGATAGATDSVALPFSYHPAAPDGGGDQPPDGAARAVFCLGVGVAGELDASPLPAAPGHWFVAHGEANAARQTLLCSDPFEV